MRLVTSNFEHVTGSILKEEGAVPGKRSHYF